MKKLWIDPGTTGLDHKRCAILQIHAISECNGSLREFGAVMRPHPEAVIEPGALDMLQADLLIEQRPLFNSFKLASVAAFYSLSPRGSMHDAATDIRLTRALYLQLKNGEQ